ncbi:hypothetical protein ACTFIU_000025 [Dictyostelium citrinum]
MSSTYTTRPERILCQCVTLAEHYQAFMRNVQTIKETQEASLTDSTFNTLLSVDVSLESDLALLPQLFIEIKSTRDNLTASDLKTDLTNYNKFYSILEEFKPLSVLPMSHVKLYCTNCHKINHKVENCFLLKPRPI